MACPADSTCKFLVRAGVIQGSLKLAPVDIIGYTIFGL